MTSSDKLREMSQAELEEHLDTLTRMGLDDSPEFERAYAVWDERG